MVNNSDLEHLKNIAIRIATAKTQDKKDIAYQEFIEYTRKIYVNIQTEEGEEIFKSSLAKWNITKLQNYLKENHFQCYSLDKEQYEKLIIADQTVIQSKVDNVNLLEPIIVALFNNNIHMVIDGLHRLRKAKQNDEESLLAYIVPFETHINFITAECYFYDIIVDYYKEIMYHHIY